MPSLLSLLFVAVEVAAVVVVLFAGDMHVSSEYGITISVPTEKEQKTAALNIQILLVTAIHTCIYIYTHVHTVES